MMRVVRGVANVCLGIWHDRSRVLASLAGAIVLWVLLGEKIEIVDTFSLPVRVIPAGQPNTSGDGLVIRYPDDALAFVSVEPDTIEVRVSGQREKVRELTVTSLVGRMQITAEFLAGQEVRTREYDVTRPPVDFEQVRSEPGLKFDAPAFVRLTMARRTTATLVLDKRNLVFPEPQLADRYDVTFKPSLVRFQGPAEEVEQLEIQPGAFKLAQLTRDVLDAFSDGKPMQVPLKFSFFSPAERFARVTLTDMPQVEMLITRKQEAREVRLPGVPVLALIPAGAWRPGALPPDPVAITPETAEIVFQVPTRLAAGFQADEVARGLNVFVDLGEMPPDRDAGYLQIHVEGVPDGIGWRVEPAEADVYWKDAKVDER